MNKRMSNVIKLLTGAYLFGVGVILFWTFVKEHPSDFVFKIVLSVLFLIVGGGYLFLTLRGIIKIRIPQIWKKHGTGEKKSKKKEPEPKVYEKPVRDQTTFRTAPMNTVKGSVEIQNLKKQSEEEKEKTIPFDKEKTYDAGKNVDTEKNADIEKNADTEKNVSIEESAGTEKTSDQDKSVREWWEPDENVDDSFWEEADEEEDDGKWEADEEDDPYWSEDAENYEWEEEDEEDGRFEEVEGGREIWFEEIEPEDSDEEEIEEVDDEEI